MWRPIYWTPVTSRSKPTEKKSPTESKNSSGGANWSFNPFGNKACDSGHDRSPAVKSFLGIYCSGQSLLHREMKLSQLSVIAYPPRLTVLVLCSNETGPCSRNNPGIWWRSRRVSLRLLQYPSSLPSISLPQPLNIELFHL